MWGLPWRSHSAGTTLASLIENARVGRRSLPPVADRAAALLEAYIVSGTAHVRTHADVDPEAGLENIEGVLEARERVAGKIDVQIVDLTRNEAEGWERLRRGLEAAGLSEDFPFDAARPYPGLTAFDAADAGMGKAA